MKFKIQTIIIALLLIFSLLVRFYHFEYPLIHTSKWGDGTRDYLVAHYIKDGERPLVGPFNLLNGVGIKNSPFYYYILSFFLLIHDSVSTLSVVNIFFQVLAIFIIYLIGKEVFGWVPGLIAATLFSVTPEIMRHTEFIWQPNLMEPFAYLGLYFLILGYSRKKYLFLILAWVLLPMAFVIHNSLFAWLPQFAIITFFALQNQRAIRWFGVFLAAASILLYYIPPLLYNLKNPAVSSISEIFFVVSLENLISNLKSKVIGILHVFSVPTGALVVFVVLLAFYLRYQNLNKKFKIILGISFILTPIFFASLFNKNQIHYLILSMGTFCLVFVEVIYGNLEKFLAGRRKFILVGGFLLSLVLIKIFSADFEFIEKKKVHPEDFNLLLSATSAMEKRVKSIANLEKRSRLNFFQIASYASRDRIFRYPILDTILLVPLEKNLSQKLAKTTNDIFSLEQINSDDYIFVACFEFEFHFVNDCSVEFLKDFPKHEMVDIIYTNYPLTVYLTKRIDV